MAVGDFMSHLEAADSLLDLARRLGAACLEREFELVEMTGQLRTGEEIKRLEAWTGDLSADGWEKLIGNPGRFERQFGSKVMQALKRTGARSPLDCLAILRGLCRRPLGEFFATTCEQLNLEYGLPVRFAKRPLPNSMGSHCTTGLEKLSNATLLAPLPYDLYGVPAGGQVRVVLDFAHRDRLDELTWDGEKALPRIATIHPPGGEKFDYSRTDGRFFNVRPQEWDEDAIAKLLEKARGEGANLAVLPELSLPTPDALEARIADGFEDFPPIVVGGSAHAEERAGNDAAIRVNEARIYLDGRFVAMARKHKAFETTDVDGGRPLLEDLTRGQTTIMVLSGDRTRLAVAICADLQEKTIPGLLVAAGVNLLLVPAMTKKIGSFNSPICDIAGYCQGVAVIANTRWGDAGKPFLCLCAVPREAPAEQSAALPAAGNGPAPVLGVLDPNQPLPAAMSWF
ncbi:MAG TPA: hypothetical protein VGI17_03700 [Solirubrobacterales bacterium]|jgi:hypothetical protein